MMTAGIMMRSTALQQLLECSHVSEVTVTDAAEPP
jgi:hypothetical protein